MFGRILAAVVGLVVFFSASEARAERDLIVPFHEGGHLVLDQLAGLRLSPSGLGYAAPIGIAVRSTTEASETHVWFAPSAALFERSRGFPGCCSRSRRASRRAGFSSCGSSATWGFRLSPART